MTQQLKSFKRDWQRWSGPERASALALLVAVAAVLGGPLAML
jgi:hypothetical protein